MQSHDVLLLTDLPKVVEPELRELQRICIRLVRLEGEASFPGSQPVSFERSHLSLADDVVQAAGRRAVSLMRQEYYISDKSAGRRYMLLILARGAFMIDRSFEMRRLEPVHFPGPSRASRRSTRYSMASSSSARVPVTVARGCASSCTMPAACAVRL
jgi:mRNA-capping enzyme